MTTERLMRALAVAALTAGVMAATPAAAQTLCSGVGEEEREEARQGDFNLKVVYAQPSGQFLGDIRTRVLRGSEVVAEAHCPGPWFLSKLPAGSYRVEGTFEGRTQTRDISVPGSGQREVTIVF